MYKAVFGVQVVESAQQLLEPGLEKFFCKAVSWVPAEKISPTIPHGFLNKAVVCAFFSLERECLQCPPYMTIARMRGIGFAEILVDLELCLITCCSGVHFQSYMLVLPEVTFSLDQKGVE